ncbi:hypothetical protein [Pseudomonas chlororaphis]|uniref:hypothetical protein n=1 Tax=Pseudomonas chlororaphis TaxID=587753 RepID=UPI000F57A5B6|nr:hypothetical protein [Pseudomonas chlororaphis]
MTEVNVSEDKAQKVRKALDVLLRDKRTWAFVAALAAAAGAHLSPDVAQALGVLLEALQAPAS